MVFSVCTIERLSFFAPNHVYVPETLPPLCTYLNQLYELLQQRSPLLQRPDFQEIVVRDFLPLTVLQIAHRFGFWSLGHFARNYRAMFGDLPRDTLGQNGK
jgi:AraC-like DNA-binding protein